MNPFDRGLMVIFALAGCAAALAAGLALAGLRAPAGAMETLSGMPGFRETAYAILVIYLLAGIRLLLHGLHPEKRHAVVREGSLGKVRIALTAIESLVEKLALDQRGIKEARAEVGPAKSGIGIRIRVAVAPDISIPQVSESLQDNVRDRVLEVTGIEVHEIRVSVDSLTASKLRVE